MMKWRSKRGRKKPLQQRKRPPDKCPATLNKSLAGLFHAKIVEQILCMLKKAEKPISGNLSVDRFFCI